MAEIEATLTVRYRFLVDLPDSVAASHEFDPFDTLESEYAEGELGTPDEHEFTDVHVSVGDGED